MSPEEVTAWSLSLAAGVIVALVLVVLLGAVLQTAKRIETDAQSIWTAGKLVAQNTVQIPLLRRTNLVVAGIAQEAEGILAAAGQLLAHARSCPGCPACLISGKEGQSA